MLSALPSIDRPALFARLAGDTGSRITVVTSNRRLAQALARDFDAERMASGANAWTTPDIVSFAAWVERFWTDALYSQAAGSLPLLLTDAQERALWEECIRAGGADALLWLPAAAEQAMSAWRVAHEWRIAARLREFAHSPDTRAFLDWASRYEALTRERGHVDHARLPDRVAALLAGAPNHTHVVLAGFDQLSAQQEAVLRALEDAGASLAVVAPIEHGATVRRASFGKPGDEIEAAARWARARIEADPLARVGIVVPDLSRSRARVERVLTRVLDPQRALAAERPLPFNISLGLPLSAWPLAHDALALLRLCRREVPFEEASVVLRSPFIAHAESERAARASLDAVLRRRSPAEVSLDRLATMASRNGMPEAPRLREMLERLAAFRRSDLFERRGAAEWARAMQAALQQAGFPGERALDSADYQSWMKWHEALGELAAVEHVTGAMGYSEACERLARIASSMLFQPETPEVPIQVLGVLESSGLDFDALWVTGLAEDAWPMPPRPNAFVPLALQRAAGVPRADAAASLVLDERITAAWMRAAHEVVFSHARMREDTEIGPSPLVAAIGETRSGDLRLSGAATWREALGRSGSLQRIADGQGPAVRATARSGGTRLFRDQAACPFRAFAHHRLASSPVEMPEPGLDAAARGTLVHEMLARVWKAIGDKAGLDAMQAAQLDALLAQCADDAIAACARTVGDSLIGRFRALERERLIGTARDWLALERERAPFTVIAVEEKREMTFGGITVNVKLDRMDELSQGGRAVIDYKTGNAAASSWLGERPDEPQLPMYVAGSGEDVRAVAFGRLKRGEMAFCGFLMEKGLLPGKGMTLVEDSRSSAAKEYPDWTAMVAGWSSKLAALGAEFAQGEARVQPKAPSACDACDQHLFCRIAERSPQVVETLPKPKGKRGG